MGFLDKVKNMFIEEIEEDEPIKKEVIQVEIPSPKVEEPIKEEEIEPTLKREEKFVFPVYFDDKDFEKIEQEERKPEIKPVEKPIKREAYGIKKEEKVEKKVFKPTPIISPVYGVLDKNYKKDEITHKKKTSTISYRTNEAVDIDDVRKKAYGTLEDELENNLFEKTSILFNNEVDNQEVDSNNLIDVFEEPRHEQKEVALEVVNDEVELDNFEETDNLIEDELNRNYDEEEVTNSYVEELNDSDLFNLIDSMYEKKDDE